MNLLATPARRRVLFAALYFAEGAPIGFIWWALPTRLRLAGVSVEQIGWLLGVLALPWAFKFLWAPAVDVLRSPRWKLRQWIMTSQLLMIATLAPVVMLEPDSQYPLLILCLLAHAVAAATQDVSVDALCITAIAPEERGMMNGWMQAGMLVGRALFGGGALLLAARYGDSVVWILLLGSIAAVLILLLFVREPERSAMPHYGRLRAFSRALTSMFKRRNTWLGLGFALTGAAVFEAIGTIAGPLLIDRGSTQELNGYFLAAPVVAAMIAGALWGGRLSDRWGRVLTVVIGTLWIVSCGSAVAIGDRLLSGPDRLIGLLALLQALYVSIGFFSAASYALFMEISDRQLAATQFSAFMGATNGCEAWSAVAVGSLVAAVGYTSALLIMGGVSLIALGFLPALRLDRPKPSRP